MSALDPITPDELRALFGDTMPVDAFKILFPEKCDGGVPDTRPVSAVRADLVACALHHRGAPMALSKDDQAERLAMLHVLISSGMRKPVRRDFLAEHVDTLLKMPEAMAHWNPMIDEALDIMRDARVRMVERLENPPKAKRRGKRAAA